MATEFKLWCCIVGDPNYFQVSILSSQNINDLKEIIHDKRRTAFRRCDAAELNLTKVDVRLDIPELLLPIENGQYRPDVNEPILKPIDKIIDIWPQQPREKNLHVFIALRAGAGSPTIVYDGEVSHIGSLQHYQDLFIKVQDWGTFKKSDLLLNGIRSVADEHMTTPVFVTTFEKMLERPPRLTDEMREGLQMLDVPMSCFEHLIAEDESDETRYAGLAEAIHTAHHVQFYDWEKTWEAAGSNKNPLKGHCSRMVLFDLIDYAPKNRTVTTQQDKNWPMSVIVKRGDEKPRKYCPRSDFLISNSSLPRLLVEVNSTPGNSWPKDMLRMLMTGAFIVRFANRFMSAYKEKRNFVLCAIFIWDNGFASRYILFQFAEKVYYNKKSLSLNSSASRVVFLHHLYNLHCVELDDKEDASTRVVIKELNRKINQCELESLFTKTKTYTDTNTNTNTNEPRGKRARTGGGHSAREDGDGHASVGGRNDDDDVQFRAHGFEVKREPEVIVDDSGGIWEPIYEMPDHILTVYRVTDPKKEFIAKKVREGSNELEMFRLLDAIPLKSDHLISLIDSFHGWAILPKMITVKDYVQFAPDQFEDKVSEVCLGLVKGVAYLHEHLIAHRDIKPNNLVVDGSFCLKIIDFELALRVEDEDEEVDDQCGTQGWMAPEVVKKLSHSPIKADRWACGRVLLFLLDKFGKDSSPSLRVFAGNLVADNPKQRPSLLEWYSYLAPTFSNADTRKVSHPRPDPVEADKENMKPPNVKKQRLDGLGLAYDMSGFHNDMGHMTVVC